MANDSCKKYSRTTDRRKTITVTWGRLGCSVAVAHQKVQIMFILYLRKI